MEISLLRSVCFQKYLLRTTPGRCCLFRGGGGWNCWFCEFATLKSTIESSNEFSDEHTELLNVLTYDKYKK